MYKRQLLNNQLDRLLDHASGKRVVLVTGLGVSSSRIKNLLDKHREVKLEFSVSAESTGKNFEFIRHGNKWTDFLDRLKIIQDSGSTVRFLSTVTNLSLFDLHNFYDCFADQYEINYSGITNRPFLSPHVLDPESKQMITNRLSDYNAPEPLVRSFSKDPSDLERRNIGLYIQKLSERRNLKLDFLPKNFIEWCDPSQSN